MYTSVVISYCNVLFKRTLSLWVGSLNVRLKVLELMVTVKSILTALGTQLAQFCVVRYLRYIQKQRPHQKTPNKTTES